MYVAKDKNKFYYDNIDINENDIDIKTIIRVG
jgi:hypothetical protein